MLRRALLWASTNSLLANRLPRYRFVKRATRRFMPGEELQDALAAAADLARSGIGATLTLLGEHLTTNDEAEQVAAHYREVLEEIEERKLEAEISVKPSQVGLGFDASAAHDRLLGLARATEGIVWIDMETSQYVDATLELFRSLKGHADNVGVCLQSYLRRTEADLDALLPLDPAVRVVKGAYREPPNVAFARKADVDRNFVRLTSRLLRARIQGGRGRPVIASHDPRMIAEASRLAHELGVGKDGFEFGMLFGIAKAEQERLARNGYQVRVLVSYGSAWFAWYMRRLAERPANLWFVIKQLLG